MNYKVVIVGCGRIAGLWENPKTECLAYGHAEAYQQNGSFEIKGCVDTAIDRAVEFSNKYGIPHNSTRLDSVINLIEPDVVSIATPDETHFNIAVDLLENHKVVPRLIFLEKPACSNQSELNILLDLSRDRKVPVVVNHSRRFHPLYIELRKNFINGELGELLGIHTNYYGGWIHSGIHLVDVVRFLFAEEFGDLVVVEKIADDRNTDPTFTVRSSFGSKEIPIWFYGWNEKHYQLFDLEFRFSEGRVRIYNFEQDIAWDQFYINSMGERVLRRQNKELPNSAISSMSNAVDVIATHLDTADISLLEGFLLSDIAPSMHTLWRVKF